MGAERTSERRPSATRHRWVVGASALLATSVLLAACGSARTAATHHPEQTSVRHPTTSERVTTTTHPETTTSTTVRRPTTTLAAPPTTQAPPIMGQAAPAAPPSPQPWEVPSGTAPPMPQDLPYVAPTASPAHEVSCTQDTATGKSTATLTILLTGGQGFIAGSPATETPQGLLVTVETSVSSGGPAPPDSVPLLAFGIFAKDSPTTTKRVEISVPGTRVFPCPFQS